MGKYKAQFGAPKPDVSVYEPTKAKVYILPPDLDGRENSDGTPMFTHEFCMNVDTILDNLHHIESDDLREELEGVDYELATRRTNHNLPDGVDKDTPEVEVSGLDSSLLLRVATHLAHDVEGVICRRSGALLPLDPDTWGRPRGSYVNTIAADLSNVCKECGEEGSFECTHSSHRTTDANRYKCANCGRTEKGITTG